MNDLLLDDKYDLQIESGDLVIGNSDNQHQNLLLATEPGAWKENPLVGVGAINYLENESVADLMYAIRTQFTADGMQIHAINQDDDGKININAEY